MVLCMSYWKRYTLFSLIHKQHDGIKAHNTLVNAGSLIHSAFMLVFVFYVYIIVSLWYNYFPLDKRTLVCLSFHSPFSYPELLAYVCIMAIGLFCKCVFILLSYTFLLLYAFVICKRFK